MFDSQIVVRHSLRLIDGQGYYVLQFRSGQRYTCLARDGGRSQRDRLLRHSVRCQIYARAYRDETTAVLAMS